MNSVPCLTEFTIRLCNVSFQQKLYGREMGPNISFKIDGEKRCKTLVRFYDVLIRSCLFLIVSEIVKICLYILFLEPFHVYDLFYY